MTSTANTSWRRAAFHIDVCRYCASDILCYNYMVVSGNGDIYIYHPIFVHIISPVHIINLESFTIMNFCHQYYQLHSAESHFQHWQQKHSFQEGTLRSGRVLLTVSMRNLWICLKVIEHGVIPTHRGQTHEHNQQWVPWGTRLTGL